MKTRETIEKFNETKSLLFAKTDKIEDTLLELVKKTRKKIQTKVKEEAIQLI